MKKILINYSGSGIKTLRFLGWILFLSSFISSIIILSNYSSYGSEKYNVYYAIASILLGFTYLCISLVLATIAENSLFQKAKLNFDLIENEIEIEKQSDIDTSI